tara:strand:+ start:5096 stop:6718 length:1623 start_codon:yes stop_codon:yes gene_type:complete
MIKLVNRKIFFVYKESFSLLKDYFNSLNIFYDFIKFDDINKYYNKNDIFIFGQMWLPEQEESFYKSRNVIFLNVEQLTESNRFEHILTHIKHNMPIIDYSLSNILLLKSKIKELNIDYKHDLLLMPYQFNCIENYNIKNNDNNYEYDVGMINAFIKKDDTNLDDTIYKRNIIWEKIQKQKWKYINILGWGEERDLLIQKCKIIINVHNFNVFNIFEHIRCDRMIFANKIIISDKSLLQNLLDIKDFVIWEEFDKIIDTTHYVLDNFDKFNIKKDFIQIINDRKNILEKNVKTIMSYPTIKYWYKNYGIFYQDTRMRLSEYHKIINISYGDKYEELVEQYLVMKYITPSDVILEIGGNIGRVSCLVSTIIDNDDNLLVLECDKLLYKKLLQNKIQNNLHFNIENKALSSIELYQLGWNTYTIDESKNLDDESFSQLQKVDCITLDEINKKYNIHFNTLIIDCEGAFYYIIQSFPNILNNICKIIIENDYPTWERKQFVEDILLKHNFETIETISLSNEYHHFHPDKLIRDNFYQVKIKNVT